MFNKMKLKKFKQFILERNDFSSWEKPDDNPTYDSWVFPSKDALRLEYKVEHELKGHDWFKSEEEFIEKYLSLQLSVIDTGIGISKEGLKKLFIDFGKLKENENQN